MTPNGALAVAFVLIALSMSSPVRAVRRFC